MSIGPRQQHLRRTPAAAYLGPAAGCRQPALRSFGLWSLLLLGVCLVPSVAAAWTESTINGVQADLAVDERGQLIVELHLQLEVRAGWLSRLELSGLDADLTVDPEHPPIMISDEGGVFLPELSAMPDGNIELTFPKRMRAPRRGQYALSVTYTTAQPFAEAQPVGEDRVRLHWRLPAWEKGLENTVVQVTAPADTRPVKPTESHARQEVTLEHAGNATLLRFHRAKLPRMTPMNVAFDIPMDALAEAALPAQPGSPSRRALQEQPRAEAAAFFGPPLWFMLALLACLKLLFSHHRANVQRQQLQFLVTRLSPFGRGLWALSIAGLGTLLDSDHESLSISLGLAIMLPILERRAIALPMPGDLERRIASSEDMRALRGRRLRDRFDLASLLDPTAPLGVVVLVIYLTLSIGALPIVDNAPRLLAFCLLSLVPFVSGARRMHPATLPERAHLLMRERDKLGEVPSQLWLYAASKESEVLEARLSLDLVQPISGLRQASLVLGEHRWLDRCVLHPCWLLVVDADSAAEQAARRALPAIAPFSDERGAQRAFLATAGQLKREAHALSGWLSGPDSESAIAA